MQPPRAGGILHRMMGISTGELLIITSICCMIGGSFCAVLGVGFYLLKRSRGDGVR